MKIKLFVFNILYLVMVTGCASLWDPVRHGVSLETGALQRGQITDVALYRMDQGLMVMGEVGVRSLATRLRGYVEVAVVGPDGSVVMTRRPDHYLRSEMHDETDQRYTFSIILPMLPERGSIIRLIYHSDGNNK